VRWFVDAVREGRRRRIGLRSAFLFVRGQAGIRLKNLVRELVGLALDLRDLRRPGSGVLLVAHWNRLSPSGLIEAGYNDLRDRFIAETGATIVRSRLAYRLRAGEATCAFSLEPFTSAPPVRFSPRHASVILVADTWDKTWMARHLTRSRATHIVSSYVWWVEEVPALRRLGRERWRLFPWWVPDEVVIGRPARAELEPSAIVVGALGPMYDLRAWAAAHPLVSGLLHVSAHSSAATRHEADDYFDLLAAQSAIIVAFSESERLRVPVAKYVEVPAVGALLIGARAHHLEEMGFRHGENCLLFEGREDFAACLQAFLDRPDEFIEVAARGLELVRSRHTTSARLQELRELLNC
jgi:hypothetical protein